MNLAFPTHLRLSIVQTSATMSLHGENGISKSSESFSLVLRTTSDENIALSTGERLSDLDVHLTLSTKWKTAQALDRDLIDDDVGFLAHIEGERGEPFIHGGALLSNTTVIAALLSAGTNGRVTLVLPSVPSTDKAMHRLCGDETGQICCASVTLKYLFFATKKCKVMRCLIKCEAAEYDVFPQ